MGQGWCGGTGGNYDGSAITTDGFNNLGNVYAASETAGVDVWKNGTYIGNPFTGKTITGHGRFARSVWGIPLLVAPDAENGQFWISLYGNSWAAPLSIPAPGLAGTEPINVDGQAITQLGYDVVMYGTPYTNMTVWIFYDTVITGEPAIQGTKCTYALGNGNQGMTLSCLSLPNSHTDGNFEAYSPAAAVNYLNNTVWLSYWNTNASPVGTLQMNMAKINPTDGSFTNFVNTGVTEAPCARADRAYWGDYDSLIISNYTSFPALLRYLTDSTDGTCNTATGEPQHVSVTFGSASL